MNGIRNIVRQRVLLSKLLKVTKSMRSFIAHRLNGSKDLQLRLEQSETDLATIRKAVVEGAETLKKAEGEGDILD